MASNRIQRDVQRVQGANLPAQVPALLKSIVGGASFEIHESVKVSRTPGEAYSAWRKLPQLADIMEHIESVMEIDQKTSRWVATLPGHLRVQWEARIVDELEGRFIAWQSAENSRVGTSGAVFFRPSGEGCKILVWMIYRAPAGIIGAGVARLLGADLREIVKGDLEKFKSYIESEGVWQKDKTNESKNLAS